MSLVTLFFSFFIASFSLFLVRNNTGHQEQHRPPSASVLVATVPVSPIQALASAGQPAARGRTTMSARTRGEGREGVELGRCNLQPASMAEQPRPPERSIRAGSSSKSLENEARKGGYVGWLVGGGRDA